MGIVLDSTILEIVYISVFIFWLMFTYFVRYYDYWPKRGVPQITPVFPLGSLPSLIYRKEHHSFLFDQAYKNCSQHRYFGIVQVRTPTIVINDPDLIKDILSKNFNHFTDRHLVELNTNDYLNRNILTMRGKEWKEMRIKLTPAYTACKMKVMFFLVKECCNYLQFSVKERLKVKKDIDVKDLVTRYTIDVIGNCAFGVNSNTLNDDKSQFFMMIKHVFHYDFINILKCYLVSAFPVLNKLSVFTMVKPEVKDYITKLITETVSYRELNKVNRFDFLDLLIKIKQNQSILDEECGNEPHNGSDSSKKDAGNGGMTIESIAAETYIFFAAGFDTSSAVIAFCLYELACNQTIQDKVFQEIDNILFYYDGEISYKALQEMTYLDQVINETMRLYPPVSPLNRVCTQKYKIPNSEVELEEGITVLIPIYSLHRDSRYYPDPEIFNPERFSPENCQKRNPYVFLPFGEGPRMCIGLRFGLMLVKAALVSLLSQYALSLHPDTPIPLKIDKQSYMLQPYGPLKLKFSKRVWETNDFFVE